MLRKVGLAFSLMLLLTPITAIHGQTGMTNESENSKIDPKVAQAFQSLQRELARSLRDANAVNGAIRRLEDGLSSLCVRKESTGEATAAPPSDSAAVPDRRPSAAERALREQLTLQTHRPAGPVGTQAGSENSQREETRRLACTHAILALKDFRAVVGGERGLENSMFERLQSAIGRLTQR